MVERARPQLEAAVQTPGAVVHFTIVESCLYDTHSAMTIQIGDYFLCHARVTRNGRFEPGDVYSGKIESITKSNGSRTLNFGWILRRGCSVAAQRQKDGTFVLGGSRIDYLRWPSDEISQPEQKTSNLKESPETPDITLSRKRQALHLSPKKEKTVQTLAETRKMLRQASLMHNYSLIDLDSTPKITFVRKFVPPCPIELDTDKILYQLKKQVEENRAKSSGGWDSNISQHGLQSDNETTVEPQEPLVKGSPLSKTSRSEYELNNLSLNKAGDRPQKDPIVLCESSLEDSETELEVLNLDEESLDEAPSSSASSDENNNHSQIYSVAKPTDKHQPGDISEKKAHTTHDYQKEPQKETLHSNKGEMVDDSSSLVSERPELIVIEKSQHVSLEAPLRTVREDSTTEARKEVAGKDGSVREPGQRQAERPSEPHARQETRGPKSAVAPSMIERMQKIWDKNSCKLEGRMEADEADHFVSAREAILDSAKRSSDTELLEKSRKCQRQDQVSPIAASTPIRANINPRFATMGSHNEFKPNSMPLDPIESGPFGEAGSDFDSSPKKPSRPQRSDPSAGIPSMPSSLRAVPSDTSTPVASSRGSMSALPVASWLPTNNFRSGPRSTFELLGVPLPTSDASGSSVHPKDTGPAQGPGSPSHSASSPSHKSHQNTGHNSEAGSAEYRASGQKGLRPTTTSHRRAPAAPAKQPSRNLPAMVPDSSYQPQKAPNTHKRSYQTAKEIVFNDSGLAMSFDNAENNALALIFGDSAQRK